MQDKLKCAIYTRVSTDMQAEREFNSCEAQEEKIRAFIKSQDSMEVFKVYSDPGYSGGTLNRPAFQEMITDIKQNKINLVISYKIDRFTRSPKDFYQLIELFEKYSVDFISVTERFDTSTPSGRLLRNIMLTFAQFERELASERTRDKMIQRAQKGMWNGGIIPFGYKTEDKKLLINEKEAKVIRDIYENFAAIVSLSKVYNELKDNGITDRKGNTFSKTELDYILRNIVYTGKIKYTGKVFQGLHKPIISEELFNLTQDLRKKRKKKVRVYKDYTLAGLVKCRECASFMTPCRTDKKKQGKLNRFYYYRCTKTFNREWNSCNTRQVNANRLEDYVFQNLERISIDRHYIDSLIFRLNNTLSGDRSEFKLSDVSPKLSGDLFQQTLQCFIKGISERKGIEKNMWAQKFIKEIQYSESDIQINLFYPTSSDNFKSLDFGGQPVRSRGQSLDELTPDVSDSTVRNSKNGGAFSAPSNYIPIILPNIIHKCRKKNL